MPWEKKGPADRTLVFDTFVAVHRDDAVYVGWQDANLSAEDRLTLLTLLTNLSTLGRAESWVEAELAEELPEWNCDQAPATEINPVRVFCPDPSSAFAGDRYPILDAHKLAKGKINPAEYLFHCPRWHLCIDTETLHQARWPTMPGARWINYSPPVGTVRPQSSHRSPKSSGPTVAYFLLDGPVLPLATDTIVIAEQFRRAAMSQFGKWCRRHPERAETYHRSDDPNQYASPILSGKDASGKIACSHGHAYYLPTTDVADRRHIRYVTVFAREGLPEPEIAALSELHCLNLASVEEVQVRMIGLGQEGHVDTPLFQESTEWFSWTPYLAPSHVGLKGQDRYLRKAVRREWRRMAEQVEAFRDVQLLEIDRLSPDDRVCAGRPRPLDFRRGRSKHHGEPYRACGFYRLRFSAPIPGPLSLGYASHFGLGLFGAEDG
jgi:CRISPR-associated protein Csb2